MEEMSCKFVQTAPFLRAWEAMGLSDDDLLELEQILLENPEAGDTIQGTGGARKIRIQLNGHGKRGGGRVIYLNVYEKESIFLLFAYPKSIQDDLASEQRKAVAKMIELIKKEGA